LPENGALQTPPFIVQFNSKDGLSCLESKGALEWCLFCFGRCPNQRSAGVLRHCFRRTAPTVGLVPGKAIKKKEDAP
jgi:hypothetical protein